MKTRLAYWLAAGLFVACAPAAQAACYGPKHQLEAKTVNEFLNNSGALLQAHPDGGARMISTVRDLVASNSDTLSKVVGLLGSATTNQGSAIGTGLAQAASICVKVDAAFSKTIGQVLAGSGSKPAIASFSAGTGTAFEGDAADQNRDASMADSVPPGGGIGTGAGSGSGSDSGGGVGGPIMTFPRSFGNGTATTNTAADPGHYPNPTVNFLNGRVDFGSYSMTSPSNTTNSAQRVSPH